MLSNLISCLVNLNKATSYLSKEVPMWHIETNKDMKQQELKMSTDQDGGFIDGILFQMLQYIVAPVTSNNRQKKSVWANKDELFFFYLFFVTVLILNK